MEADIKLVDLRKETLGTVREAIKVAATLGPAGFKFYVNKNFIKNGLIITKIVPVTGDEPPKTQDILNYMGLKNLKKTLEFAKKVLVEDGEVTVEEKFATVVHATEVADPKIEASPSETLSETAAEIADEAPSPQIEEASALSELDSTLTAASEEAEEPKEEIPAEYSKKRKPKKGYSSYTEEAE
jgi:hypothetical protein